MQHQHIIQGEAAGGKEVAVGNGVACPCTHPRASSGAAHACNSVKSCLVEMQLLDIWVAFSISFLLSYCFVYIRSELICDPRRCAALLERFYPRACFAAYSRPCYLECNPTLNQGLSTFSPSVFKRWLDTPEYHPYRPPGDVPPLKFNAQKHNDALHQYFQLIYLMQHRPIS